jgi:Ca2+/Na+ antiporter
MQLQISKKGTDRLKRVNVMKKQLRQGAMSLRGVLGPTLENREAKQAKRSSSSLVGGTGSAGGYQTVDASSEIGGPSPEARTFLQDVLSDAFKAYDLNGDGKLERNEVDIFLRDTHESIEEETMAEIFRNLDVNRIGSISFDQFITACYVLIKADQLEKHGSKAQNKITPIAQQAITTFLEDDKEEQEEIPKEIADLSPAEQQVAIKKNSFTMLFVGTVLIVLFSDPVVHVLEETANRLGLSPFYVAFVIAPIAANASEIVASQYYAAKKTSATITVSFAELTGAGAMNNTFCLSTFMGLIYVRGLAWEYTAETIAIVLVEFIMAYMVQRKTMTTLHGVFVLLIFPLSIAFIVILESFGID